MLKAIQLPASNYSIIYYQTLDEVTWLLGQEKISMFSKKLEKNTKFCQKNF